jgi:microcin C transport system ATP-binding protein
MSEILAQVRDFHAVFGRGTAANPVVHGINFDIHRGEIFALVGESGSGKTVTAQAFLRLYDEASISYPRGSILFEGKDILALPDAELRSLRGRDIGMVFQEPMISLNPLHTIEKQLAESLRLHRFLPAPQCRAEIIHRLERVGLANVAQRIHAYPHQLSGGERQRVMIALALINDPKLFIADEPTTALDVTVQAQILSLIKELQRELGMAVLFITHDLGIVRRLADRVAVMRDGHIVETGPVEDLFAHPQHPYTVELIGTEASEGPEEAAEEGETIAEVNNLRVHYPLKRGFLRRIHGYVKAVDGVDFSLHRGKTLGIVGESGCGKTTLAKALLRLEQSEGSLIIQGFDIRRLSEKELRPFRRKIQIIFQDPYGSLSPRLTIRELVGEGLLVHRLGTEEERRLQVLQALSDVGLGNPEFLDRYPNEFSGGQRQRIAIARALVLKPEILVLDEPTSSLDRTVQFQIVALLKDLQIRHGLSYIFISHDLRVVRSLCHDVIIMRHGRVVERGPAEQIFNHPQESYTRELLSTAFSQERFGQGD